MTGVETNFAAIAAEAFGVDPARVRVVNADTSSAPYAPISGGSKIIYTVGRAVERAAIEARERLLEEAAVATSLEIPVSGSVRAEGELDFRGTLGIVSDDEAPVGFRAIRLISTSRVTGATISSRR